MSLAEKLKLIDGLQCLSEEAKRNAMAEIVGHYKELYDKLPAEIKSGLCPLFRQALAGRATMTKKWKELGPFLFHETGLFPRIFSGSDTREEAELVDKAITIYRQKEEENHGA